MKTNHTPGPWIVSHRNPEDNTICIDADRSNAIARVAPKPFYHTGEQDANAQLIASAPELLDTLKLCEEALGENLHWLADQLDLQVRQEDSETLRKLTQLRDAWHVTCKTIAKAEGK